MSFEADSDGEDPPEIIPDDDEKTIGNLYMPPCEEGYLLQIDDNWHNTALENEFCRDGGEVCLAFRMPTKWSCRLQDVGDRLPAWANSGVCPLIRLRPKVPRKTFSGKNFKA